jgi:hypothetical protein
MRSHLRATPRRTFLSWLGLSGAAAALPLAHASAESFHDGLDPVGKDWDLSWTRKLTGKYRAVFDGPAIGGAADRAMMWRSQYATVFGLAPAKMTPVVVIRHMGIPMVMNDAYWDEFNPGRPAGRGGPPVAAVPDDSTRAQANTGGHGGNPNRAGIEQVIAAGGVVLACNVAFSTIVIKYKGSDAREKAIANMIPGIILQPSGPFALMRAQDEGCHYMLAT